MGRIEKKESLVIYGDGLQTRDFVNVEDVANAVLAAITAEGVDGEVFIVGSVKPTSINELAKSILELVGLNLEISYESSRAGDIKEGYADISKARKFLGFKLRFL